MIVHDSLRSMSVSYMIHKVFVLVLCRFVYGEYVRFLGEHVRVYVRILAEHSGL